MASLSDQLAAILSEARRGRSRKQVARDRGKSDTPLSDLERGRANPTLRRLETEIGPTYGIEFHLSATPARNEETA